MKIFKYLYIFIALFSLISCSNNEIENSGNDENNNDVIEYPIIEFSLFDEEIEMNANDDYFSPHNVEFCEDHPLNGKNIYWLGSSVTYGSASNGASMAEYVAYMTGATCTKDAVSGTTIFDDGSTGNTGSLSYTRRLKTSTKFDVNAKVDAFICQISTNDAKSEFQTRRGEICDSLTEFDLTTTLGGVEFIINYVKETWDCPVYFYSGSYISVSGVRSSKNPSYVNYSSLISDIKNIAEKYNSIEGYEVGIIDLFNDKEFNDLVDDKTYLWMMSDPIHPKKAGYSKWWSPYFANYLGKEFAKKK